VEAAGSTQPGSSDKPVPVIAPDDTVAMAPPVPRPEQPAPPKQPAPKPEPPKTPPPVRAPIQVRRLRRGRLAIRKIDPWSVLKFSLVFYFCMLLIMMLATAIIFGALKAFGVIHNLQNVFENIGVNVNISGGLIFRWFFLIGIAGTVVASAITVFMAFLYNLIADVVGGIELLVTERE
jgi:hypothetical protein